MITSRSRGSESGVALLTAVIIVVIVGGIAAAFLMLSYSQSTAIARSSEGEVALHVAEAGIDDCLNMLTAYAQEYVKTGKEPDWTLSPWLGVKPDWAVIANPSPVITGSVNGGTYSVTLKNLTNTAPMFTGAFETYVIVSTGTKQNVVRNIEVMTSAIDTSGLFPKGLFGDVEVDALGTFQSDGYDSSKGAYSSQPTQVHTWPSGKTTTYVNATGSIGSNGNIISNGNAQIMGDANPGPGGTTSGGGNIYGSTSPSPTMETLQAVTYSVPATAISYSWPSGNATLAGGASGAPVVYHASSLTPTGKGTLTVTGEVILYVDGDFDMNNQQAIKMSAGPPEAKLTIYQKSGDMHINGQAFAGTGAAKNFQIYSASTGNIQFNGGSEVYAAVYAPKMSFTNNGGNEFFGAMVASTMKLSGTAYFHYDEDLKKLATPIPTYKVISWREILQ